MLNFKLLGTLEVLQDNEYCTPTAPRVLSTLALLLVRANHVVSMQMIVDELWGEQPPRSAATTAQTYIYQLRRLLDGGQSGADSKEVLATVAPGYLLRIDADRVDLHEFERLTTEGQAHLDQGRAEEASDCLNAALRLWSGVPMANVPAGRLLTGHIAALHEQYSRALDLRISADLALGRHHQLIPELRTLVAENPFNEWYHSLLVFTLGSVGRRCDALEAYRDVQRTLSHELGLEPSPELSRMQAAVLQNRDVAPPSVWSHSSEARTA